jgi:SAM-dependent methyltransferase
MSTWQQRYLRRFYGSRPGWIGGTQEFWRLCEERIVAGARVLEIGAGPENATSGFLAGRYELHGVDVDPAVETNRHLRTASVCHGATLPYPDLSFDACVSNFVLEHVEDPGRHLSEVARVLRPGGVYAFRTPNRYHYVSLAASVTPHWVHGLLSNRLRGLRGAHDPYPTFHRLNSRRAVAREAAAAGLDVVELRLIEKEPSYGMSSRVLFLAFTAYERAVNASDALAAMRANILAVLRKR